MKFRVAIFAVCILALAAAAGAETLKPAAPTMSTAGAAVAGLATPSSTQHYNAFTYAASADSTTAIPGTTNLYRISGPCQVPTPASTSGFAQIQTNNPPSAAANVFDTSVKAGDIWSYVVTAVIGGKESNPSSCWTGTTPTFSVGGFTGTSN